MEVGYFYLNIYYIFMYEIGKLKNNNLLNVFFDNIKLTKIISELVIY